MSDEPKYDILIVSHDLNRRFADGMTAAVMRWLATNRVVAPVAEAIADTWVEVYMDQGATAQEAFVKGSWDTDVPIYREAMLRSGMKAVELEYGIPGHPTYFYLEFRGCIVDRPLGRFLKQLGDITSMKPQVYSRPAEGTIERREVGEDEQPKDRRKRPGRGPGVAGTHVEEW